MKTKTLNKEAMIRNIRGLSLGDRAYCGPYGTITCTHAAGAFKVTNATNEAENFRGMHFGYTRNSRKFSVSGSKKLRNGGNWSMTALRKAITK